MLGILLRRNHSLKPAPKSILFIKIMGIGSVLMAADAILAVKQKYTGAKLILLANKSVINGIRPAELFDEYREFRDHTFWQVMCSTIETLVKAWRSQGLWVANLEVYSKLTTVYSLWTCARNRFDFFFNEVSFRKGINTHPVYFNQFGLAHENYDQMASAMGADVLFRFEFPAFSRSQRNNSSKKYIVISNTCSELARERLYPAQLLATLCTNLNSKYKLPILLSGTGEDRSYYDGIIQMIEPGSMVRNVAGEYSINEFLSLLYHETLFLITVDSAPLHYAWRLGVPTISLWGPTNPSTRMTTTPVFQQVYLNVACSPCTHHTEILPCGGNNFCMKEMSVNAIIDKTSELVRILQITIS